ncbi:MAG TPA: MerR family transcriptional regulator [Polyangia bacterium]|nr:MerR family transcriptional regulator [Polyangia bacterium]
MEESKTLLKVGELARESGKTVRALHLYEELGLLKPAQRTEGGFRLYAPDARERIVWIARLQDMGFSLQEITEFLRDWEHAKIAPEAMRRVRGTFEQKLRETREHMARVAQLEQELLASLHYLDSCRVCEPVHTPSDCVACDRYGHTGHDAPLLVAGIAHKAD